MREKDREVPALDMERASDILSNVFRECGQKPNSVPMEALSAYTIYRRERFGLQRGFLVTMLVLFFLLPFLFIDSRFTVRVEAAGERKLPVYVIEVRSFLPVHRVTACVAGQALPVYEADAKTFTVEPTRNGEMTVEVALLNRQNSALTLEVTDVDNKCPVLVSSEVTDTEVRLYVEDAGTGVHPDRAYGVPRTAPAGNANALEAAGTRTETGTGSGAGEAGTGNAGAGTGNAGTGDWGPGTGAAKDAGAGTTGGEKILRPIRTDPEKGLIVFAYPKQDLDVYIPDHIGNVLHLALKVGTD